MTTVVYYSSTDAGAPTLNNAAGSMISVLDACLVNGYGSKPVTSIVVAGGVATVTCSAHGFTDQSVQEIAGATPAALNGRKLVTVTGSNTFTFPAPGVPDGSATGTITAKRPGLGWVKQFASGATKAVYRRSDPAATAMVLRVADTGLGTYDTARTAEVTMYESMSDVDTGTNPSPLLHGQTWPKGSGSATPARWVLVGDSRTFYLFSDYGYWAGSQTLTQCGFGDGFSYRAADAYACIIFGPYTEGAATRGPCYGTALGQPPAVSGDYYVARLSNGLRSGQPPSVGTIGRTGSSPFGSDSAPAFPSPVDNGGAISYPVYFSETNVPFRHPIRGELRGLAEPLFQCAGLSLTVLSNVIGSDRRWLVAPGYFSSGSDRAFVLIDTTGPWQA